MVEFTGERVVPGQVDDDLWSEHFARYAFAQQYAAGKRVLDCGCGTGYGTAELAKTAAEVTGIDIAPEATEFARENYPLANARFLTASCLDLPFEDGQFDVVTAFELIEHLQDFRTFLSECRRVLAAGGLLIASTPNKRYYAESRAEVGPNPYHQHEFEADEFRAELQRVFPEVSVIVQNHVESVVFQGSPAAPVSQSRVDGDSGSLDEAHFFIALCSQTPLPPFESFIYVPNAANLLREREHHIRLLEAWLAEMQHDRDRLLAEHRKQLEEHDKQNCWARELESELKAAQKRIVDLQQEFAEQQRVATDAINAYAKQVSHLEAENDAKTRWALETDERGRAEIERLGKELEKCSELLQEADEMLADRTEWAQNLAAEKEALNRRRDALESQLRAVRTSRWVRAGRILGIGPVLQ